MTKFLKLGFNFFSILAIGAFFLVAFSSIMLTSTSKGLDSFDSILVVLLIMHFPLYLGFIYLLSKTKFFSIKGKDFFLFTLILAVSVNLLLGHYSILINFLKGISHKGYSFYDGIVYHNSKPLKEAKKASENSFKVFAPNGKYGDFALTDKQVFYKAKLVPVAHAPSFQKVLPLERDGLTYYNPYFKDKDHVFFNDKIISNADPESFVSHGYRMAFDKNHVYYDGSKLENFDRKSLALNFVTTSPSLIADKNGFWEYGKAIPKIPREAIWLRSTLALSADKLWQVYDRKTEVRVKSIPYPGDDQSTLYNKSLELLEDKNHFYLLSKERVISLDGIDKESFSKVTTEFGSPYFKDKNHVFYLKRDPLNPAFFIVEGANPHTFNATHPFKKTEYDGKDGDTYFKVGKVLRSP